MASSTGLLAKISMASCYWRTNLLSKKYVFKSYSKTLSCLGSNQKYSTEAKAKEKRDLKLTFTSYPGEDDVVSPDKAPMLILHGLFGARANFNSVCKQLSADGRRMVVYDARNHGESEHSGEHTYPAMAEDAAAMKRSQNLDNPVILGHSMGGKTAMVSALTQPELWRGLVVGDINPCVPSDMTYIRTICHAMAKVRVTPGLGIMKARMQARQALSTTIEEKPLLEFLLTNLREYGPRTVTWRFNLPVLTEALDTVAAFPVGLPGAAPYGKPTLFIYGQDSEHYRNLDKGAIRALFPAAEFEVIPEAGHFIHAEKPQEFVNIVNSFLKEIDG